MERALDPVSHADELRKAIASESAVVRRLVGLGALGVILVSGLGALLLIAKQAPFSSAPDAIQTVLVVLFMFAVVAVSAYPSARLRLWGREPLGGEDSSSPSS